jgi:hypothetical protein
MKLAIQWSADSFVFNQTLLPELAFAAKIANFL